jgi:hypothetical protein
MKLFWYIWDDGSISLVPANDATAASLAVDELIAVDPAELKHIAERDRFGTLKRLAQIDSEDPRTLAECGEAGQFCFAEVGSRKPRKLQH